MSAIVKVPGAELCSEGANPEHRFSQREALELLFPFLEAIGGLPFGRGVGGALGANLNISGRGDSTMSFLCMSTAVFVSAESPCTKSGGLSLQAE